MKPTCIGLIGGAGPLAGAHLLNRIFSLSIEQYGCKKDADFPKVILISYPFSEMLIADVDRFKIQNELKRSLQNLRQNGAEVLAIACNTLHAFLTNDEDLSDLVHLPSLLREGVIGNETPLVLCTSTSRRFGLHQKYFKCTYPSSLVQEEIDEVIDQILGGAKASFICNQIEKIIQAEPAKTIILGCTELSLFADLLNMENKQIIDPLDLMAKKIINLSFKNI